MQGKAHQVLDIHSSPGFAGAANFLNETYGHRYTREARRKSYCTPCIARNRLDQALATPPARLCTGLLHTPKGLVHSAAEAARA